MPQKAQGLYDYLNWRGDLPFESVPLCEVDNLIFSLLTYIDFSSVVPLEFPADKKAAPLLSVTRSYLRSQNGVIKSLGLIIPKETVTLLARASKTARFGLTKPICFVNRICDEELDAYVCDVNLDQDEMMDFLGRNTQSCPYYRYYDEYKSVHKQI